MQWRQSRRFPDYEISRHLSRAEIAVRFNVTRGAVRGILTGKNWSHI